MAVPKFYLNNKLIREPLEYRGLEVELNFENPDAVLASVSQEKFTFVGDNADALNDIVTKGTSGGLGVFWGIPFRIEVDSNVFFDGYVDLTLESEFSCEKVIAKVRERDKLDWIESVADGFSFDLLYEEGHIKDSDFVNVPYILSEIPDYKSAAFATFMAYVLARDLVDVFDKLKKDAADLAGVFSTIAGAVKFILTIAYLLALIIAIIKLFKDILDDLIVPVKYHRGMLVKTHFEVACDYLGLDFKSSLFQTATPTNNELGKGIWKNLCLLPKKTQEGYKRNRSTDQVGYFDGTFGDFIRGMEEVYNAKIILTNKILRFERRDYGSSTQVYKIPDIRRKFNSLNTDELVSNYLVQFTVDNLDLNTVNRYRGTAAKNYITSKIKNPDGVELIRGFVQPRIPFAVGRRKNELTRVEKIVKAMFSALDQLLKPVYAVIKATRSILNGVVSAINAIITVINVFLSSDKKIDKLKKIDRDVQQQSLAQKIGDRIGMLKLSSDFIGVPKLIEISGEGWDVNVTEENEEKVSAQNMWNKYHYLESFVPSEQRPNGNQAYIYEMDAIPFCVEDYYKIRGLDGKNEGEARIVSPEGRPAKLLSLRWNIWNDKASIRYKEERLYTTNLKEQLIIDEGE